MSTDKISSLPDNPELGDYQVPYHEAIHWGLKYLKSLVSNTSATSLYLNGDHTIQGTKTFSGSMVFSQDATVGIVRKSQVDSLLAAKEDKVTAGATTAYRRGDKTWQPLNKASVGLSDVDNTTDASKPISTATQTELNKKQSVITSPEDGTTKYYRGDKQWVTLDRSAVSLNNVDNTSDLEKQISNPQASALSNKQAFITVGETFQYYRGDKSWQSLNRASVGLDKVDNTSDLGKPVSDAVLQSLQDKIAKESALTLTGAQTISGPKTFQVSPKIGSPTVGHVWKATATDGSGSWQPIGELVTTVDWNNITPNTKPTTFAPVTGTTRTTAAPGNHTHSKADIGLENVDNTADADKVIPTQLQNQLDTIVSTGRLISTSSRLAGGGSLSDNLNLKIADEGITIPDLSEDSRTDSIVYFQTLGKREVGYGQVPDGFVVTSPITITKARYKAGTADGSGETICHIRKNGVEVTGTSAPASAGESPWIVYGTWEFNAGDVLSVYTSQVGTSPGARLRADIVFLKR